MNLRELLTKWKFDVDEGGLHKLHRVEAQLEGIKARMDAFATAEIVKKLFEMAEKFSEVGEEIKLAAEAAGISAEAFQKLAYAANLSNVSQEEMGRSLQILSRHLYAARNGSQEAVDAFTRVGFSQDQINGFHTSQDALNALSDRFKNIKDPIQKAALAQELLGRNSQKMIGFLSQGSAAINEQREEAQKLGIVLSTNQVQALVELDEALKKFGALLKGIGMIIASDVAPVFRFLIQDFIKFFQANRKVIDSNIRNFLLQLAFDLGFVWGLIKVGTRLFLDFAKALGIQNHLLEIVVGFVSVVTGLIVFIKIFTIATGIIGQGVDVLNKLGMAIEFVEGLFGATIGTMATVAAAIFGIVYAAVDLYRIFNGEKGWTIQFLEFLGIANTIEKIFFSIFEVIQDIINLDVGKLADKFASFVFGGVTAQGGSKEGALATAGNVIGGIGNAFGFGGANGASPISPQDRLSGLGASPEAVQNTVAPAVPGTANNTYEVNAPITITVPEGTPPGQVGKSVQDGVKEHLAQVMRETQRSTRGAIAY